MRAEAADNVVVMLDPGHDSTHTGAAAYGLKEQQLNLKTDWRAVQSLKNTMA